MNWPLVIEAARILVVPLTASLAVYLGLRAFRRQKAIERRVEWLAQVHRHLSEVGTRFDDAAMTGDHVRTGQAFGAVDKLLAVVAESWLFAGQVEFSALVAFVHDLNGFPLENMRTRPVSKETAAAIHSMVHTAQIALSEGARNEMNLPQLKDPRVTIP